MHDHPVPSPAGFPVPTIPLPSPPAIDQRARADAALLVLAIGRGLTPEEVVIGCAHQFSPLLADPLERAEADAFVAMLAEVIA